MKQNLIKILIVVNTIIFIVSLAIIYYKYSTFMYKEEQKSEQQNIQFQQNTISTFTFVEKTQKEEQVKDQSTYEEEQNVRISSSVVKLRKPKFVYFSYKAKKVSLIGDFNNWVEQPMKKVSKNKWEISIEIPEGTYLYNFVVDGTIVLDPNNKNLQKLSKKGYKSSVLELK